MHKLLFIFCCFIEMNAMAQSVGIGTATPSDKAALDITSTSKGILFPRLTTSQRDAIVNPPNGLHIFNTTERSLNYYDSVYGIWNSYDPDSRTVIITIKDDACKVDVYNAYATQKPSSRYLVYIPDTVTVSGCQPGDYALNLSSFPFDAAVKILNRGVIQGAGGNGGNGTVTLNPTFPCQGYSNIVVSPGQAGGAAIVTKAGITVTVSNYGTIGGGGGGGGSGAGVSFSTYGGGGGGGAGIVPGNGGEQGFHGVGPLLCSKTYFSQAGTGGGTTIGGVGGLSTSGGGAGANGGGRGQQGGNAPGGGTGGTGGKAISGGTGNTIINLGSGLYFGLID